MYLDISRFHLRQQQVFGWLSWEIENLQELVYEMTDVFSSINFN